MNSLRLKILVALSIALLALVMGTALGSVYIPPSDIIRVIGNKALGIPLPGDIKPTSASIVWSLRLPRTLLAFIAGGALSVSGAVMQSVLRNPLASSYTLGVSSGASLGACAVILYGFSLPFLSGLTLPLTGFVFGMLTIFLAVALASRLDGQMQNNTIILTGMVFSLFINAATTLMSVISGEQLQRLIYWQMGSFSMKGWSTVFILAPVTAVVTVLVTAHGRELDIMTFGEDQAGLMGVNTNRIKWLLLVSAAALTGSAIAFVGVIGFVDLITPHIVRKLFGSLHKRVIPMSAVIGGTFMVICDLGARTAASGELPVGAVTAIIGAPFFAYIYFGGRRASKC